MEVQILHYIQNSGPYKGRRQPRGLPRALYGLTVASRRISLATNPNAKMSSLSAAQNTQIIWQKKETNDGLFPELKKNTALEMISLIIEI